MLRTNYLLTKLEGNALKARSRALAAVQTFNAHILQADQTSLLPLGAQDLFGRHLAFRNRRFQISSIGA